MARRCAPRASTPVHRSAAITGLAGRCGGRVQGRLPGSITVEYEGARKVLVLVGEIDVAVVHAFEADNGTRRATVEAIDAGAVTYMGAAGIGLMLRCRPESASRRRPPVLRASSRPVDRLLALTGLEAVFER